MTRAVKIGIFFVLCTLVVVFYIFKSADIFEGGGTRTFYALADNAMGLLRDSDILVSGVVVGKLNKIELEKGKAKLTLKISKELKIYENSKLEKIMESMLGTNVLMLYPGDSSAAELHEFDYIKNVKTDISITEAMDKTSKMMEKTKELISKVLQDENQEKLNKIIDMLSRTASNATQNFEGTMALLTKTLKNIAEITDKINLRSESEMDKLSKMMDNTILLTDKINKMLEGQGGDRQTEMLNDLHESLKLISEELKSSKLVIQNLRDISDNVNQITGKVAKGEGSVGKLLNDEKLYNDIVKVSDKLTDYADTFLGMQVHVDTHSNYMVFNNAFKTYFDLTLQPRSDRFYMFGIVDDPRGKVVETSTKYDLGIDDGTQTNSYLVTENKVEVNDQLKFNLQIGRIFGPVTLRGGIFQNKAGLGIDYNPWKFASFSAEIFDFTNNAPQLKIQGLARPFIWTIEPFSWLYLTVGGSDLINNYRDLYFGLGLRFTDNDLKSVIPSIPTH